MHFKAWNPKRKKLSQPFTFKKVRNGIYTEGKKDMFDLSRCIILRPSGLYDIHLRHMWEGDLVEFPLFIPAELKKNPGKAVPVDTFTDVVMFVEGRFILKNITWRNAISNQSAVIQSKIEIVGNIFQHSHLLEINLENIKI